jgi:hypothetical protein
MWLIKCFKSRAALDSFICKWGSVLFGGRSWAIVDCHNGLNFIHHNGVYMISFLLPFLCFEIHFWGVK